MTSVALTAPSFKRLFERLGFLSTSAQPVLKSVLEQRGSAGVGVVAPSWRALTFLAASDVAKRIFVYRPMEGEHDYVLVDGAAAIANLLQPEFA